MCTTTPQAILTIGEKPGGIFVTFIDGERPLDDFVDTLAGEDRTRVPAIINSALNSCAIPKVNNINKPIPNLLRIYYGVFGRCDPYPQVKLYMEYSKERPVFVTPPQTEQNAQLLEELKKCVALVAGALPRKATWHLCGEDTEKRMGFRA